MRYSDNMRKINITLYEPFAEMILRSLELYAYNLHFIVKKNSENYELENIFIKYAYEEILQGFKENTYKIGYNCISQCDLEIARMKKQNFYKFKKNIA